MTTRFHSYTIALAAVLLFLANPAAVFAAYTSAVVGVDRHDDRGMPPVTT